MYLAACNIISSFRQPSAAASKAEHLKTSSVVQAVTVPCTTHSSIGSRQGGHGYTKLLAESPHTASTPQSINTLSRWQREMVSAFACIWGNLTAGKFQHAAVSGRESLFLADSHRTANGSLHWPRISSGFEPLPHSPGLFQSISGRREPLPRHR